MRKDFNCASLAAALTANQIERMLAAQQQRHPPTTPLLRSAPRPLREDENDFRRAIDVEFLCLTPRSGLRGPLSSLRGLQDSHLISRFIHFVNPVSDRHIPAR